MNLRQLLIAISFIIIGFLVSCGGKDTFVRNKSHILIVTDDKADQNTELLDRIQKLNAESNHELSVCSSLSEFGDDSLFYFSTVFLLNRKLDTIPPRQLSQIERYVQAGGGLMLINSNLNTPYTWPWYEKLIASSQGDSSSYVQAKQNQAEGFAREFEYDGGRIAIAELNVSTTPVSMVEQGIPNTLKYLIGNNSYTPSKAHSSLAPDERRFTKVVLDNYDINEPMELAVMPSGKVLFIERRGKMKLYDPEKKASSVIAEFEVCMEGNYEDGLLGLALDPNFESNHYLYLYYSPPCETWEQYLSRFTMYNEDSIILESEKVMLKVPVQRETCCHSGGSVTFDDEGYLYLSTGDNTSSKESNGYSPLDERPGRGPFDAQKSSGNTNDLRGKILRIKPHPYGTYSIPDGNLFPKDGSQGRPEIYVMGARNPFRISVDPVTKYVYWGDVGPDVGRDGKYGPESFDEWNQARTAGNFGWPYFVGANYAYRFRDFEQDTVGVFFDPLQPVNNSPNNTGSKALPPARPAFIWYGKSRSKEFPMLQQGSNSAMAGPIYRPQFLSHASNRKFPSYYEGKLFIYEWARSYIKVVSMDSIGNLTKIEPFMPKMDLSKPIDMEFGPDGAMYMLEYGQNYFMNNPEAKLVRIDYANGNRKPVAQITINEPYGAAPYTFQASGNGSYDYDFRDSLTYSWYLNEDTNTVIAEGINPELNLQETGNYRIRLKVTDKAGAQSWTESQVRVGNESPSVAISYDGNQDFFLDKGAHTYKIEIKDREDQQQGGINRANTEVQFVYVADGQDLDVLLADPKARIDASSQYLKGKQLIANSDCSSCHALKKKSVGPSYYQVAERYRGQADKIDYLGNKIILGGNGNWGEKIMAGHPQHSIEETREMAKYILSLGEKSSSAAMGLNGQIVTNRHLDSDKYGAYILAASYTDKGANEMPALSQRQTFVLRAPHIELEDGERSRGTGSRMMGAGLTKQVVNRLSHGDFIAMKQVDLTDVRQVSLGILPEKGGSIRIFLDSLEGQLIGQFNIPAGRAEQDWTDIQTRITEVSGRHDLFLVIHKPGQTDDNVAVLDWMKLSGGQVQ